MAAATAMLACLTLAGCESQDGRSVHFTAAGDMGLGRGAKSVLDVVARLKPDFSLALGDLSYRAGAEEEFCAMVTEKLGTDFPYQLATGNHESNGKDGNITNFVQCLPNRLPGLQGEYGKQWYVDVPREKPLVRLIVVSPGIPFPEGVLDYSADSERGRWTESAIDGAHNSNIPWTVVAMHTPCLSLGHYGCVAGEPFTNLLLSQKADLVLTGHEHVYQRTHQLALGKDCPEVVADVVSEACMADRDDSMKKGAGTVFATAGTGGVRLTKINTDDPELPYFASWLGANEDNARGTLDITVTSRRMDVKFIPNRGSFSDAFSIEK
ncbi:metallophosphoesterase [Arthrobacter sp. SLBN-100]|uniref:metallophosphoesterase n=1 Tax=Arthrobacter sp. SLBN-100 TaxID=2768450 RepID=UPI001F1BCED0|nr:metallophosphoesterase [Arthrobacter sp. SLBN-100]